MMAYKLVSSNIKDLTGGAVEKLPQNAEDSRRHDHSCSEQDDDEGTSGGRRK